MNSEEKALIQKAQKGDIGAFETLVKKHEGKVLSLLFQMLGNTEDAEDVYQEAFMKVYSNIEHFRFQSDFFTWVYRIAFRCAIDYRKKRNVYPVASYNEHDPADSGWLKVVANPDTSPLDAAIDQEIRQQIQWTMDSLPVTQRIVFFLRFIEDLKIKDIAEIIGCSQGTVKNCLFRSTEKARIRLSAYLSP